MFQAKNSPFGQTPFGQQPTTGFNPPVFGSTANTGLFSGNTTQQSPGLFGSNTATPSFGQAQTSTPAFGGFTSTSSGTGLFGQQQNVSAGLFGSNTTSTFGQPKPAFSGFGTQQTGGLFGQQQQQNPVQQPSLFGQPSTQSASGLFGTTPGFGATATATEGTTIKFVPPTGTDTMMKGGVGSTINTRHHCITCMKEYENKSMEELRFEDYAANRKGPAQGVQPGLFGATNQPSLFSSTTNTGTTSTGLFGGENKSLFGATNQGVTSFTNTFGAGTSGSTLFGKPAGTVTAFATPSATTTNTFGAFNTNTSANPFGAQKPFGTTTQAGFFGSTPQPTNAFGAPQTGFATSFQSQPAQNGGIFGQNKQTFPMGTTNAFSFNQPASSGATTSIFGAKPTTSGFGSFGSTTAPNTGFTGTTFGANNQNTSAFGSNFKAPGTTFNFGSTPTTSTLGGGLNLGGGSSLFGGSKPGGLFGTQPSTGLFSGGFGSSGTNFNTGSNTLGGIGSSQPFNLGGGLTSGQNTNLGNQSGGYSNPVNLLAYGAKPFEDSPIFKDLLNTTGKADELIKTTSPAMQKALISGRNYKVSPKSESKIKVKSVESNSTTKKSLFDGLDEDEISENGILGQTERQNPRQLILRPKPMPAANVLLQRSHSNLYQSNMINELSPVVKTSPKLRSKINMTPTERILPDVHQTPISSHAAKKGDKSDSSPLGPKIRQAMNDPSPSENKEQASTTSSSDSEMEDTLPPEIDTTAPEHPTGIVLRRLGYYTIPTLDELTELMDSEGRCIVDTFTIGRLNYGNIFYPESFDVAGLNLDEIVHFRHKEVIVYPDDEKKPPHGTGLNRRAQVTLDRVWPEDKTTRLPISDPVRISLMEYENKLRRASAKQGSKFLDYRPQTGSWVFKVDHFSKYGLSDSEEDEQVGTAPNLKGQEKKVLLKQQVNIIQLQKKLGNNLATTAMMLGDDDEDMDDGIATPYDLADDDSEMGYGEMRNSSKFDIELGHGNKMMEEDIYSPRSNLAKELGSSSHKVQLMKASFFDRGDFEIDGEFLEYEDMDQPVNFKVNGFSFDAKKLTQAYKWCKQNELSLIEDIDDKISEESPIDEQMDHCIHEEISLEDLPEPEKLCPKTYVLNQRSTVLPYPRTTAYHRSKCCVDMEMFRGRSFRTCWGPLSSMTVMNTEKSSSEDLISIIEGRNKDDTSPCVLELHKLYAIHAKNADVTFEDTVLGHLKVAYSQSVVNNIGLNPYFTCKLGTQTLSRHLKTSKIIMEQLKGKALNMADRHLLLSSHVWGLCLSLWGDIDSPEDSHAGAMIRKEAVSKWLEGVNSSWVENKIISDETSIFTYMTRHKIAQACEEAQDNGDHHLSLLLSQSQSSPEVRDLVEKQLLQWADTKADEHIDIDRLKCLMLVAGLPVHKASIQTINSCEGLNWLQSFGIHLWYINSNVSSLTDSLLAYDIAFGQGQGYAPEPRPLYSDDYVVETNNKEVYDIIYHLLKLFSVKSHPLEPLLNPATYTPELLDYRLSWFLMHTLTELGYSHLSHYSSNVITTSFASQLEAEGLWEWAIFVLMHLQDPEERERNIKNIIGKYVSIEDENEKETFLVEELYVMPQWIYEAKAIRASFFKKYHDAAKYFIKSEKWEQAHEIIINHIVPKAIILNNHDLIENLLGELSEDDRFKSIPGWSSKGFVILRHLRLIKILNQMLQSGQLPQDVDIYNLQTSLHGVCYGFKNFVTSDPLQKLSLQEMAANTINIATKLALTYKKHIDKPLLSKLIEFISELPLPKKGMEGKWLTVTEFWNRI